MQIIDIFSGVGGFSLAGSWLGWHTIQFCEIDKFCQRVLRYYWPDVPIYDDIKTLTAEQIKNNGLYDPNEVTILTAGVPCQPWSMAGKRKGREDDRNLWPQTIKLIGEFKPDFAVLENVYGLINWDGGVVFNEVQADLETEGYEVQPYVLPAAGVGAPHKRNRIWFIAKNTRGERCNNGEYEKQGNIGNERKFMSGGKKRNIRESNDSDGASPDTEGSSKQGQFKPRQGEGQFRRRDSKITPDIGSQRLQGSEINGGIEKIREDREKQSSRCVCPTWKDFPTQSPICCGTNGVQSWMVRVIKSEIYGTVSERYTDKDLQEVWNAFQSEEIRNKIGRLYKIHDTGILFQVLQSCLSTDTDKKWLSPWSEKASEKLLRKLQQYGTFTNTPQGRELEKQFTSEFSDSLPYLSHEIALVAMEAERATKTFISWHRNESIKAMGNSVVVPLVYQIFKAIELYQSDLVNSRTI